MISRFHKPRTVNTYMQNICSLLLTPNAKFGDNHFDDIRLTKSICFHFMNN